MKKSKALPEGPKKDRAVQRRPKLYPKNREAAEYAVKRLLHAHELWKRHLNPMIYSLYNHIGFLAKDPIHGSAVNRYWLTDEESARLRDLCKRPTPQFRRDVLDHLHGISKTIDAFESEHVEPLWQDYATDRFLSLAWALVEVVSGPNKALDADSFNARLRDLITQAESVHAKFALTFDADAALTEVGLVLNPKTKPRTRRSAALAIYGLLARDTPALPPNEKGGKELGERLAQLDPGRLRDSG